MYFSRSLLASAVLLSFSATAGAGVVQRKAEPEHEDVPNGGGTGNRGALASWPLRHLFGKRQNSTDEGEPEQNSQNNGGWLTCGGPEWRMVSAANRDDQRVVCSKLIYIANVTTDVEVRSTM